MSFENELEESLFIRRTTEDKLTYKNIIADAINSCRKCKGKLYFKEAVEGLVDIIEFNVRGYPLKNKLEKIRNNLEVEKKQRRIDRANEMGRRFYRRDVQAKFKIEQNEWYWRKYFKDIIQLLADNNLLMDTGKDIPVKEVGDTKDESEQQK